MKNSDDTVNVTVEKTVVEVQTGTTVSEILHSEKPCGGHGKCGKCRVTVRGNVSPPTDAERKLLSKEELKQGVRLACSTYILGECEIRSCKTETIDRIVTESVIPEVDLNPSFSCFGAAIDIGTTTLAARLFNARGKLLAETSALNSQSECGADVISRIEASLNGQKEYLANLIRDDIDRLLSALSCKANIFPEKIDSLVITGNTVMLTLLIGESVELFSHAPFEAQYLFGDSFTADNLGLKKLKPNTVIRFPKCISAFVGADITCSILATQLCDGDTALLADIGTNGEMALWHNGKLTVCSTAAGPAFEGVGISMGMRGSNGAVDKVRLLNGKLVAHIIGEGVPTGICGSGLIDAAACMLDTGVLDESGNMDEECFTIAGSVALIPKDIRMLQLAKSSICAGLLTLLNNAVITPDHVSSVFIAGGFGYYLNIGNAAKIGLLPQKLARRVKVVGNTALGGASLLLLNRNLNKKCNEIATKAKVLDLSTSSFFRENFLYGMTFGET